MKLVELNPRWIGAGGDGVFTRGPNGELVPAEERCGVGLTFDCPCGCGTRAAAEFTVALDGKQWRADGWERTGDTFETLTLRPSLQRAEPDGCRWHGFITDGEARSC